MKNARLDLQIKTKKITFFARKNGKGEFLEGEVNLVTGVVTVVTGDGETEKYRQDETTGKFESVTDGLKTLEVNTGLNKPICEPEFGELKYFPNGDVGRWQPNLDTGKMELYIQKAKYTASMSPYDPSRHGKHGDGGRNK